MKPAWYRRHPLTAALLLSAGVHLALLWDGEFSLDLLLEEDSADEILERKKAEKLTRVKLAVKAAPRPQAVAGVPQVTLLFEAPPAPKPEPPKPKPVTPPKPVAVKPAAATAPQPDAAPEPVPLLTTAEVAPGAAPAPAAEPAPPPPPPAPAYEPPPAFPAELQARYRAVVEGIRVDVQQIWRMEGFQYSIENSSSFIGIKFRMAAEGEITPDGGLKPADYRVYMNKKLLRFASFDYGSGILRYGKPDKERVASFGGVVLDPMSLGYQIAVGFTGEPMQLHFTTGTSVSAVTLALVGEETLKLPGGVLRTHHIQGKSVDGTPFNVDVWLAPDHLNFPARLLIARKGEVLELSLRDLAFEGQVRFGKNLKADPDDEAAGSMPKEWLERPELKEFKPPESTGMPGEDSP